MLNKKMRELDQKILLQLLKNSEQPIREIATKVGASRQTVAKKIERLKATGVITSFTAKLNPEKFGLTTKAYIFLREDPRVEVRRKSEQAIEKFHQVLGLHRLFGRYSAILEVLTKDKEELTRLIRRIHRLKGVRETETFIVHTTVKDQPEEPFLEVLKVH